MKTLFTLFLTICTFSSFNAPQLAWVAIGDSITYLNDHLDETANRVTKGYLSIATEQMPDLHYINHGYNGWTAVGLASNIEELGLVKADVYTIFLGTNDWWQGKAVGVLEDFENGTGNHTMYGAFRTILDKIRQLNAQAKIVLITPMQRNDFVYIADANNNAFGSYKSKNGQSLEEFAEAVKTIGKLENIIVIDLYNEPMLQMENLVRYKRLKDEKGNYQNYPFPASVDIAFDPIKDEYPYPVDAIHYTYDGLHPSDEGNKLIAQKVIAAFRALGLK